jgi:hypothetical protein
MGSESSVRERVAASIARVGLARTAVLLEVGEEAAARIASGALVRPTTVRLVTLNLRRLDGEGKSHEAASRILVVGPRSDPNSGGPTMARARRVDRRRSLDLRFDGA